MIKMCRIRLLCAISLVCSVYIAASAADAVSMLTAASASQKSDENPRSDDQNKDMGPTKNKDDANKDKKENKTPEQKMAARFPQPAKVGDLIGRAMLDTDDHTLGYVQQIIRTPDGKVRLVFPYGRWFGWVRYGGPFSWSRRPIAIPIEAVAAAGLEIFILDRDRMALDKAPTSSVEQTQVLSVDQMIDIAVTRH